MALHCYLIRISVDTRAGNRKLTAQRGRLENVGTEPGTFPVGNTRDTVASCSGAVTLATELGFSEAVCGTTSASPMAEHCVLVTLRMACQVRLAGKS